MPVEFAKLHHLTIGAPSGEQKKARWFYGEVLGLKEVPIPKDLEKHYELIWYELLTFLLHIEFSKSFVRPKESYEKDVILPGNHFAFEVKNIKKMKRDFEMKKVEIHEAVTLSDRERFYAVDPFGNFFEFIEFYSGKQ